MKINLLFIGGVSILVSFASFGQNTLTLQPNAVDGKDARINSIDLYTSGTDVELPVAAWTFGGNPGTDRAAIGFDLSSLGSTATIVSANLYLYGSSSLPSGGHSTLSGSNEMVIDRITSNWNENTVNWATLPSVTTTNEITTAASTSIDEDYIIDVTSLVQDMVTDPSNSYGFMFKLLTETQYRRMDFCSSDNADSTKHPKLVIIYSDCPTRTLSIQPNAVDGKDARINSIDLYTSGTDVELPVAAWTFGGNPGTDRAAIGFDLGSISTSDNVLSANLYLYGSSSLPSGGHSTLSGSNEMVIDRITSNWNENTVNWATLPSVTTTNEITTAASTSIDEDYIIDVTSLVQDMVTDPSNSYGFMFKLLTETQYRRMDFCSSDNADSTKHPKLVITYQHCSKASIKENKEPKSSFNVYPNPSNSVINISLSNENGIFQIYDIEGKLIVDQMNIVKEKQIDISQWKNGYYFVRVTTDNITEIKKIIKY